MFLGIARILRHLAEKLSISKNRIDLYSPIIRYIGGELAMSVLLFSIQVACAKVRGEMVNPYCSIYEGSKYHSNSVVNTETTESMLLGETESVAVQLNSHAKKQISYNRRKIIPIIKTAIVYGQQDTRDFYALRVYEVLGMTVRYPAMAEFNDHDENIPARFRYLRKHDFILKTRILSSGRHCQYTSPGIQNEIMNACSNFIFERLADSIDRSGFFRFWLTKRPLYHTRKS